MESGTVNIHQGIIDRCKEGDRNAQKELYHLYFRAMFNTAQRITNDEDDAADVLQDSFISAFRNLGQYRGESSFGAWLKRIVINKSLNLIRKRQNMMDVDKMDMSDEPFYEWEDVPDHSMTVKGIQSAIGMLPDGFRNVLTLYLFEGYDHKEIGEILGISESTSKSQYNRAKKKIRAYLQEEVKYG